MKGNLREPVTWPRQCTSFYGLTMPEAKPYFDDSCSSSMNSFLSQLSIPEPTMHSSDLIRSRHSIRAPLENTVQFPIPVRQEEGKLIAAPPTPELMPEKKSGRGGRKKGQEKDFKGG